MQHPVETEVREPTVLLDGAGNNKAAAAQAALPKVLEMPYNNTIYKIISP